MPFLRSKRTPPFRTRARLSKDIALLIRRRQTEIVSARFPGGAGRFRLQPKPFLTFFTAVSLADSEKCPLPQKRNPFLNSKKWPQPLFRHARTPPRKGASVIHLMRYTSMALRVVISASSAASMPRRAAIFSHTKRTWVGSFRRPRMGSGAR